MNKPRIRYHPVIKEYSCTGDNIVEFSLTRESAYLAWQIKSGVPFKRNEIATNNPALAAGQLVACTAYWALYTGLIGGLCGSIYG